VALDLSGGDAVRAAAGSLLTLTEGQDAVLLVERMVRGAREFMIGMKRDPLFGPVVVFGVGGIFTEAHKDIALGVTPLDDRDIEGMLTGIRASVLLDDFRGLPPVDRARWRTLSRAGAHRRRPSRRDRDRRESSHRGRRDAGGRRRALDPRPDGRARRVRARLASRLAPDLTPLFRRVPSPCRRLGRPLKWGGSLLLNLIDGGFAGPIYPVNAWGTVCGLPAFRSIAELPEAPDLALVTLGATRSTACSSSVASAGSPSRSWCATSRRPERRSRGKRSWVQTARASGVHAHRPQLHGLVATHSRLHAVGFSSCAAGRHLSIVSQSATSGAARVRRRAARHRYRQVRDVGNEASTSALDVLDALRRRRADRRRPRLSRRDRRRPPFPRRHASHHAQKPCGAARRPHGVRSAPPHRTPAPWRARPMSSWPRPARPAASCAPAPTRV